MKNTEKINYALITALYTSKTRGLYSDVYFPIIKYAVVTVMSQNITKRYFSSDEVYDVIYEQFGITIPDIVIVQSLKKIAKEKGTDIEFYNDERTFEIKSFDFKEEVEQISENGNKFHCKIEKLEQEYKRFLEKEGMFDDHLSVVKFISDNTSDILETIGGNSNDCINDGNSSKYVTLTFFFQYLRDNKIELYEFANRLFWSSVIAAFLSSEQPLVYDTTNGIRNEYFLDTPIVMGLLELSTPQNESSSRDVCEIIKSSGGFLKIHPITLTEIKQILYSVEVNGPKPLSSIDSAYSRYELTTQKIAKIRINLQQLLQNKGVSVFPNPSQKEIDEILTKYQNNAKVKLLGNSRSRNPYLEDYSDEHNSFRDIHDIYMNDFIKEKRKGSGNNNIWFITSNRELVSFCKEQDAKDYMSCNMIVLRRVILELWMHSNKPVDVSGTVFVESMARCIDSHRIEVRYKLKEISKYYNETKDDFDINVYKDFIKHLYRRAKNVINAVDSELIEGKQFNDSLGKTISEAVNADQVHYNQQLVQIEREKEIRDSNVKEKTKQISELSANLKKAEEENQKLEEEKNKETNARQTAEEKNRLYEEREKLRKQLKNIDDFLKPLESERKKSFCNWAPLVLFGISLIILVLSILGCKYTSVDMWIILAIGIPCFVGILVPGIVECSHTSERRNAKFKDWEEKNPNYLKTVEEKKEVEEKMNEIDKKLGF